MVIYFSGTGNSRYCARMLADKLEDELLDSANYIKHGIAADLTGGKPWVFVCPTYAWQIPRLFEQFIRSGDFRGSRKAYFVLTCGGDIGNAGGPLEALCREKGLTFMGVLEVPMPENYVALFSVPDERTCAQIIAAAGPILAAGADCIRQGKSFPARRVGPLDRLKSGAVNRGFYKLYVKANSFYTTDQCVGCGKCGEVCVLNNIRLQGDRPVWGACCTHCMACICTCPAQAIEYGRRSRGKRRYLCPEYD